MHPLLAIRSCDECRKWLYDEKSGKIKTQPDVVDGELTEVPIRRGSPELVPCNTEEGCPKGHYSDPVELTEQYERIYEYYLECRAVNDFPASDGMVRLCARLIREAEDHLWRIAM